MRCSNLLIIRKLQIKQDTNTLRPHQIGDNLQVWAHTDGEAAVPATLDAHAPSLHCTRMPAGGVTSLHLPLLRDLSSRPKESCDSW